jgi:hypothetical protein
MRIPDPSTNQRPEPEPEDQLLVETVASSDGIALTIQLIVEPQGKTSLRVVERLLNCAMLQLTDRIRRGAIDHHRHDVKGDG